MTAEDQMPDRLGPYRLLEQIGEGGMGVVFMARDASEQTVALKVLRSVVAEEPTGTAAAGARGRDHAAGCAAPTSRK